MSSLGKLQIPPLPAAETVIVVPTFGAFDCVRRLLLSLESTTPADIPILLVDDAHPGETLLEACGDLISASHLNLITVRLSVNHGFVGTCNLAFAAAGDADVIVCNSDVRVTQAGSRACATPRCRRHWWPRRRRSDRMRASSPFRFRVSETH